MENKYILLLLAGLIVARELFNRFKLNKTAKMLEEARVQVLEERNKNAAEKSDNAGRDFYNAYGKHKSDRGDKGGNV